MAQLVETLGDKPVQVTVYPPQIPQNWLGIEAWPLRAVVARFIVFANVLWRQ